MKKIANDIKSIIEKVYAEIDPIDQAIQEVKNDSDLSDQGKKARIEELEMKRDEIVSNARREVKTIGENGKAEYSKKYSLNADDHEILIGRKVGTIEHANDMIDGMTNSYFESAMSRPQYRDTWLSEEYVDGISEE